MRRKDREINDINEIEEIISKADVCRIAFADNNIPYIVTMNFGYTRGENKTLWFHSAHEGRKIDLIRKNAIVCFEMDIDHELYGGEKGCDWGMHFKSIVGYGKISIVTSGSERITGLDSIMEHYSGQSGFTYDEKVLDSTTVLKLEIDEISGKKR
jgi:uncharacterized protein